MANSVSRIRPPTLPVFRTCIWKVVGNVQIALDIYLPANTDGKEHPVLLFIHGGGWIGSNKMDYSRPLFEEFLSLGFIVVSIDYRLLPETPFASQLEDIQDIEPWLRINLSSEISETTFKVSSDHIAVAGGSAGAHLALLTPKLWSRSPVAILSLYGPTNLHQVPYLNRGRLPHYKAPNCTPEVLAAATDYEHPPTDLGCPNILQAFSTPRSQITLAMFRDGVIVEFLLNGLTRHECGTLEMPKKGSIDPEQIDEISPLHILTSKSCKASYPPTYQVIGTADDIFATHHVTDFHDALISQGIESKMIIVEGKGHAFDVYESIGGDVHRGILAPAVEWIRGVVYGEEVESGREELGIDVVTNDVEGIGEDDAEDATFMKKSKREIQRAVLGCC